MLYFVHFIVIYGGMYVKNMVNILYKGVFLTIITWLTLYTQVGVLGDGYKGSMEENGIYRASGVLWDYSWGSVGI